MADSVFFSLPVPADGAARLAKRLFQLSLSASRSAVLAVVAAVHKDARIRTAEMLPPGSYLRGVTLALQRPQDEFPAGEFAAETLDKLYPELPSASAPMPRGSSQCGKKLTRP